MQERSLTLRPVTPADHPALWDMLRPVFRAGDTYAIDRGIGRDAALAYWCGPDRAVWLAEDGDTPLGTCYLRPNAGGGGAHVCNAGFVTAAEAQGRGVARRMLAHVLHAAREAGFAAMQFNFVVSTNSRAVALWRREGFDVVGRLPGAFRLPDGQEVDALVMYRRLQTVCA
ncbi:MAG: N-acetyltransferase family protein [Paracoccaceae bacterium]